MNTIKAMADKIRNERERIQFEKNAQIHEARLALLSELKREFDIAFKEVLPALKQSGITYSPHFNSAWDHDGCYILFEKGEKSLKMDFSNRSKYRYEYSYRGGERIVGCMVYAKWSMDDFIVWIDGELLKEVTA